jgi:hypothetical protein
MVGALEARTKPTKNYNLIKSEFATKHHRVYARGRFHGRFGRFFAKEVIV